MRTQTIPVLIVGGGPVGLMSALLLERQGIPALVIERHPSTSIHPRARGIHVRTMEILHTLGLDESVRQAGAALANNTYFLVMESLAGTEYKRMNARVDIDLEQEEMSPQRRCACAQDELEPVLVTAARERGIDLHFGHELLSFQQDESGINAQIRVRDSGEEYAVHAQYMIAADGSRSAIRRSLNIGSTESGIAASPSEATSGSDDGHTLGYAVNIYFRADLRAFIQGREFILGFIQNHHMQNGVLLSVNNTDRWLLNVPYYPERGETSDMFTPQRCQELVRYAVGVQDLEPEILGILPWEMAVRVATRFQSGRVFLVGDAAHVMPPSGAFGMNTGIQDAQNLAWKLAAVLKWQAGPELLASYDEERRPVAQFTTQQARLRLDNNTYAGGQSSGDGMVDNLTVMLGYRYRSSAIVGACGEAIPALDLRGQPGSRAPHVWLERSGQRISTIDLFGTHFVLLCGNAGNAWYEAAKSITRATELDLDVYRIGKDSELEDPQGQWGAAYGVSDSGAVLVRPDGFVSWRCEHIVDDAESQLLQVLQYLLHGAYYKESAPSGGQTTT